MAARILPRICSGNDGNICSTLCARRAKLGRRKQKDDQAAIRAFPIFRHCSGLGTPWSARMPSISTIVSIGTE